ncbi:hypothetical protein JXA80_04560 [bacterium]|nr:hypothetical protein [candidate division CSSED10-310 bacterium]
MRSRYLCLLIVVAVFSGMGANAANWDMTLSSQGSGWAWNPSSITIEDGDTVTFWNYSTSVTMVSSVTGSCPSFTTDPISGQPYPGSDVVLFDSGPCYTEFMDVVWSAAGTITVVEAPTPTPDPYPDAPAMSPAGLGITLAVMSLLIGIAVFRKK